MLKPGCHCDSRAFLRAYMARCFVKSISKHLPVRLYGAIIKHFTAQNPKSENVTAVFLDSRRFGSLQRGTNYYVTG
jgi:hypothetical protein